MRRWMDLHGWVERSRPVAPGMHETMFHAFRLPGAISDMRPGCVPDASLPLSSGSRRQPRLELLSGHPLQPGSLHSSVERSRSLRRLMCDGALADGDRGSSGQPYGLVRAGFPLSKSPFVRSWWRFPIPWSSIPQPCFSITTHVTKFLFEELSGSPFRAAARDA
jgi:hypothetical protein